jgi:hypothetical protein
MGTAIGVEIFLFDKSGFGPHTNLYPLGAGSTTCAISWEERNAEYSFSFTAEVEHARTTPAVPECRSTISLNRQTVVCFSLHLCPLF